MLPCGYFGYWRCMRAAVFVSQGLPDVLIVERADEILTRQTENKSCQPRN